jgi:hypothetical protein
MQDHARSCKHENVKNVRDHREQHKLSVKLQCTWKETDFASILDWSTRNGLCLNSEKTQVMAIYRNEPSSLPPVKVGDAIIPYSTKEKNLGVLMNCKLTWDDQISSVVSGVYGALSRLWCSADFFPVATHRYGNPKRSSQVEP